MASADDTHLFMAIFAVARRIPPGSVMSYGQVGAEAGGISPRIVGWAMANAAEDGDVPWQRVVGADGYLRIGRRSAELQSLQRRLLESEGIQFLDNGCVNMRRFQVGVAADAEQAEMEFDDN